MHKMRKLGFPFLLGAVLTLCTIQQESIAAAKPARVQITKVSSTSAGKVKVSWKKVTKTSKYQLQVATKKSFKGTKVTKTIASKKKTTTVSNLFQGKTYYVRIRAYRSKKGKKQYGTWSKVKKIKVKATSSPASDNSSDTSITPNNSSDDGWPFDFPFNPYTPEVITEPNLAKLDLTIDVSPYSYGYTGEPNTPKVTVRKGTRYLYQGVDYQVTYSNNIEVGEGIVTITGIGKYCGSVQNTFEIRKSLYMIDSNISDTETEVYMGTTKKIELERAYGDITFSTSRDGIIDISEDGVITPISSGRTSVYVSTTGDNHYGGYSNWYLGKISVLYEDATACGFSIFSWSSKTTYKSRIQESRQNDGSNIYDTMFLCNSNEKWIEDHITFEVEDVTPTAYAKMFNDMGIVYQEPKITALDSAKSTLLDGEKYGAGYDVLEPFTDEGTSDNSSLAMGGKILTISAGPSVRVIKVIAKKGNEIVDTIYLGSNGMNEKSEYSSYDLDLYKQVRQCVEAKLWTAGMTKLEKLQAVAKYINTTTHYPGTEVTLKQYNPTFWKNWAVDDKVLLYYMCNDVILNRIMDFQGGITTCLGGAQLVQRVGTDDLDLPYLYDSVNDIVLDGEGVWVTVGSYSSAPYNPSHYSIKYKDTNEVASFIDAQGLSYSYESSPGKVSCEGHGCAEHIISLK